MVKSRPKKSLKNRHNHVTAAQEGQYCYFSSIQWTTRFLFSKYLPFSNLIKESVSSVNLAFVNKTAKSPVRTKSIIGVQALQKDL